jgi:hypothetical protein
MNMEAPMTMARGNILKNCAVAADMPAVLLNEETFVEGFGEGTEDARRVAMFVKRLREEMDPQYRWFDEMTMHRAWGPEFYTAVQRRYPQVFGKISYTQAFYAWKNSFKATWPNWLEPEDNEKIQVEEVILNAAIAAVQTLMPISDPANQAALASWLADTINDQETLFRTPLEFDIEALENHLNEQKEQEDEAHQKSLEAPAPGEGGGDGEGGGGDPFHPEKVPKPKRISADSYDDKVSHTLTRLHDSVQRLPAKHDKTKAMVTEVMQGLAQRSGVGAGR